MDEWKIIPGFSKYECNKKEQIRNVITKYILKGLQRNNGYIYYTIKNDDRKDYTKSAHQLIATTWISNPDKKPSVDHINKIRNDNRVENLRWATSIAQSANRIPNKTPNC